MVMVMVVVMGSFLTRDTSAQIGLTKLFCAAPYVTMLLEPNVMYSSLLRTV